MAQLFQSKDNSIIRAVIIGLIALLILLIMFFDLLQGSSYLTKEDVDIEQPIPFSHDHHAGELGIDCRFCHTSVENSSFAGMPSTQICMKCHREIWKDSPVLEPVRESFRSGQPIHWNRVHDLPDFVYFDHSIHIKKGVSCQVCHGRIDQMPLTHKEHSLNMGWCLNCHEHPGNYVGSPQDVFRMSHLSRASKEQKQSYKNPYRVKQITNCSVCHR